MCFVDYDSPSVHRQKVVKTRKPHKCYECHAEIPVGKRSLYVFSVYGGDTYEHYTCGRCEALRRKIHDMEIKEGCKEYESWCPYGEIHEYISGYYDREYDWSVSEDDAEKALAVIDECERGEEKECPACDGEGREDCELCGGMGVIYERLDG